MLEHPSILDDAITAYSKISSLQRLARALLQGWMTATEDVVVLVLWRELHCVESKERYRRVLLDVARRRSSTCLTYVRRGKN
jgi:hypothetical protein